MKLAVSTISEIEVGKRTVSGAEPRGVAYDRAINRRLRGHRGADERSRSTDAAQLRDMGIAVSDGLLTRLEAGAIRLATGISDPNRRVP
jgi:hypothetical protein